MPCHPAAMVTCTGSHLRSLCFLSLGLFVAVGRVKAEIMICVQERVKCAVQLCKNFNLTCLFHVEAPKTAREG